MLIMDKDDFVSEPGFVSDLSDSLYQLQQKGYLCDTFIKTKSGGISAHKIVLFANGGPFIQEQISSTVSHGMSSCNIDLSHVLHEDVLAVVGYLYTGKMKTSCIQSDSCQQLFEFLEIDLKKLKANLKPAEKAKVSSEHDYAGSTSQSKSKSVDVDYEMESGEPVDGLTQKTVITYNDGSDFDNFEIENSNQAEQSLEDTDDDDNDDDIDGEGHIFDEKTGDFVEDTRVKHHVKKRKEDPSLLTEKSNEYRDRLDVICSECSQSVHECLCEIDDEGRQFSKTTCTKCKIRYLTQEDYLKHKEEKHSLTCSMCDFKITKGSNLVSHMLEKHGISSTQLEGSYQVQQEEASSNREGDQNPVPTETNVTVEKINPKHKEGRKSKKGTRKRYGCTICTYTTLFKSNFNRHLKTHEKKVLSDNPSQFVCDQCGKRFVSRYGLNLHHRNIHVQSFRHVCEICGKGFNQKLQFRAHVRQHTKTTVEICPVCSETYPTHDSLMEHFESCQSKADIDPKKEHLRCKVCLVLFNSRKGLLSHVKGKHEPPQYACTHCDGRYRWRSSLKAHLKCVHNLKY